MPPRETQEDRRRLSSPMRSPRQGLLIDNTIRQDMDQQEQLRLQQQQPQQGQGEDQEVQIVGPNEDQEVRNWKIFTNDMPRRNTDQIKSADGIAFITSWNYGTNGPIESMELMDLMELWNCGPD